MYIGVGLDIAIGSNDGFHTGSITGNDIPFIVTDINTLPAFKSQPACCNLKRQRMRFAVLQRIAADYHRAVNVKLLE